MKFISFTAKTFKILIAATVTFVLVIGGLLVVTWQINKLGGELVKNTKLIKRQQELAEEHGRLSTLLAETTEERAALSQLVLSRADNEVVTFLSYLDSLAEQMGVEMQTDTLTIEEDDDSDFDTLELQVLLDGSEDRVFYMLKLLENLPYHSSLSDITFARPETDNSAKATLTLSVTVRSE